MKFLRSLALFGSLTATATQAIPPDGQLDATFGTGGKVKLAFDKGGTNADISGNVITTPDYSYVFGTVMRNNGNVSTVTRFRNNGSIDTTYGTQGTMYFDFLQLNGIFESYFVSNGTLQPDGKLVAVGQAKMGQDSYSLVCRFQINGQLDPSFGVDGGCNHIAYDPVNNVAAYTVAIQGEGYLIGSGGIYSNAWSGHIFRLDASGKIDAQFNQGNSFINLGPGFLPTKIWVEPSGRFITGISYALDKCGGPFNTFEARSVQILKFLANGLADQTFNTRQIDFTFGYNFETSEVIDCAIANDELIDFSVADDGSIFVGMRAETAGPTKVSAMVTKLHSNGTFDSTFGEPMGAQAEFGQTAIRIDACPGCGPSNFTGFARLPNGKMIFSGHTITPGNATPDFLAIRLLPNGAPDPRFGNDTLGVPGRTTIGFDAMPNTTYDIVSSLGIQNGKPLIVGTTTSTNPINTDFALARLSDDTIFADGFEN